MRVHELAKQLNVASKELITELQNAGIDVKGHMSSIEESVAQEWLNKAGALVSEAPKAARAKSVSATESKPKTGTKQAVSKKKEQPAIEEPEPLIPPSVITDVELDDIDEESEFLKYRPREGKKRTKKFGKKKLKKKTSQQETVEETVSTDLYIPDEIQVKMLAELMRIPSGTIIEKLMEMGMMVTMNQNVDYDTASIIAHEYGFEIYHEKDAEEIQAKKKEEEEELAGLLVPKAPVVTFMGHVDHGKTSLLDYIRKTQVASSEAGSITQHIGAYKIDFHGKNIVFLDTPGHKAFTSIRARGANITDIVVLVVAADDGLMEQTREAISHARNAKVPMIVAINKIDKPTADPERIYRQLSEMNLMPEQWGGEIITVNVSALNGTGVDHLLEMILLQAEMMELKANPEGNAKATVIESKLTRGRGPTVTVLITRGTIHIGDPILCEGFSGKVKSLLNDRGDEILEAGPATPVEVLGLDGVPDAGAFLEVLESEKEAKRIAEETTAAQRKKLLEKTNKPTTLEELYERIEAEEARELKIIIKGDVHGSIEALAISLEDLSTEKISVNVIHMAVGDISESDVVLATASDAIIIGFCIRVDKRAREIAKKEGIQIKIYNIIYEAIEEVQKAMTGLLGTRQVEQVIGHAEVRETFSISRIGTIAGCYIRDGKAIRTARVRVMRDGEVLHEGPINALKRFKDEAKEVNTGFECGLKVEGFDDIEVGDKVEFFIFEEVAETL
ncbi:MAG: translation initiation factor IF-2 [Candidatus Auribacter fodinae]|jgi:translation initiation factor IF-2|uniref:Translation initiation factor IF-2 n=1 Tax=Candidatus Auribacter fodinae TaxID=2093366 RepID=A0A3A4R1T0_9BACT|nr:MAG: translation initiation factor IF-2 [Candidatus Auribacter fodinae]